MWIEGYSELSGESISSNEHCLVDQRESKYIIWYFINWRIVKMGNEDTRNLEDLIIIAQEVPGNLLRLQFEIPVDYDNKL